ncbi:DUF167 domain-containing protein [Ancylobacter sonchi]|uniref:DUF167 family protein n=1 Tax=Ancylobacter sonchi TaxID=1937790 RepID=UPI001BD420D5|nr:DUF167 family protein [Ancylobacter sonchi]MBS7534308.1 DUF167 domain-containing protein [Ancylobacter sonchi]
MTGQAAWTPTADGVTLSVRVTPRGGRDAVEGFVDLADGRQALKARVSVAPEDGKANAAVIRLLARLLDVPATQVELVAGATARLKTFRIRGDAEAIAGRLAAL